MAYLLWGGVMYFALADWTTIDSLWTMFVYIAIALLPPAFVLPWAFPQFIVHVIGPFLSVIGAVLLGFVLSFAFLSPVAFTAASVAIPLVVAASIPAMAPAWLVSRLMVAGANRADIHVFDSRRRDLCWKCGYALKGLREPVCPECGSTVVLEVANAEIKP